MQKESNIFIKLIKRIKGVGKNNLYLKFTGFKFLSEAIRKWKLKIYNVLYIEEGNKEQKQ